MRDGCFVCICLLAFKDIIRKQNYKTRVLLIFLLLSICGASVFFAYVILYFSLSILPHCLFPGLVFKVSHSGCIVKTGLRFLALFLCLLTSVRFPQVNCLVFLFLLYFIYFYLIFINSKGSCFLVFI